MTIASAPADPGVTNTVTFVRLAAAGGRVTGQRRSRDIAGRRHAAVRQLFRGSDPESPGRLGLARQRRPDEAAMLTAEEYARYQSFKSISEFGCKSVSR